MKSNPPAPGSASSPTMPPAKQDVHKPLLRVNQAVGVEAVRHILLPVDDTDVSYIWVYTLTTVYLTPCTVNELPGQLYCTPHPCRTQASQFDGLSTTCIALAMFSISFTLYQVTCILIRSIVRDAASCLPPSQNPIETCVVFFRATNGTHLGRYVRPTR